MRDYRNVRRDYKYTILFAVNGLEVKDQNSNEVR